MSKLHVALLLAASTALVSSAVAQISVQSSYTQNFDDLGTALPSGWGVWTSSNATGNGTAFTWNTANVANNAAFSAGVNDFRNLPGASQTWSAALSSGTDRALGWRAGSAASRDGSITFTFTNTTNWNFNSLSFQAFTPNSSGSTATFNLEYQLGASGTFTQLAGKSYTTRTTEIPFILTSITLTSLDLSVLNNQNQQVTLRLNHTATTGTTWNSLAIDNFTYSATAIPEPSAFAALAGLATLGLAATRRRRRAA